MNRRLMAFTIRESVLISIFTPDLGVKILHSDLPQTAELRHIYNDLQRSCFVAVFQDESFNETPEGGVIPFGEIEFSLEYVKEMNND